MEFVGILLLFAPLGALVYYVRRTSPPGPGILTILGIVVAAPLVVAPAAVAEEPAPPRQAETPDRTEAEDEPDAPKRMTV
jgi:F0F1-type ATP synthase assembly protein I